MYLIPLLLSASMLWAQPQNLRYSFVASSAKFEFTWDGKELHGSSPQFGIRIQKTNCNRELLNRFLITEEEIWKDRPATTPDPIYVKKDGEAFSVASFSRLGSHLLTLKEKLLLLKLNSEKACHKSSKR